MNSSLNDLQPKEVFYYFEQLSKIPHCSGNEKAISDYLVDFAKNHNLEVIQDKAYNIIIKKPGTSGYENAPIVILQGHMDMVCEKNKGTEHDFDKDPLKLRVVDDMLYATETTLGGDNGIAIAYALAVLAAKDIPHPPIEVLITTEEETGMGGAMALDASSLKGKYLINMDSEEEGKLLVSCSGGIRTTQTLPITWENADKSFISYTISISGLKGGHSGMEINKGRGNSNKIMGRILNDLKCQFDYHIKELNGGAKMNAIPREADAVILVNSKDVSRLESKIKEWNDILKNELRTPDPGVNVTLIKHESSVDKVLSKDSMERAIASLVLIPSGIQSMSMDIPGLVESSTNLGVVTTNETTILFESAIRSSVRSLKYNILNQAKMVAKLVNAELQADSDYPEWQYNPDSKLRDIFNRVYKNMYGKDPEITAIHAGVECGLFKEKMPELDMISFGPNMFDVHTPDEHLNIPSAQRTWDYLLEALKEIR